MIPQVIYIQYFGKFLPINKNKTIESVLAGQNYIKEIIEILSRMNR